MQIPAEAFVLPPAARGSLQQRIRQMVTEGVLAGRFRAGQKMPSSRGLALHLQVSRLTVTLAYAELVSSDYLTARGRSGYFISEAAPLASELPLAAARVEAVEFARLSGTRFSGRIGVERPEDWESYGWPFIYGQADPTLFDHQNWRLCAVRALGRRDFAAMTADYYDRDDPLLIDHVLRQILPRRGIAAREDEVLLTLGAQNGLWITAACLLGQGESGVSGLAGHSGGRGDAGFVGGCR
jgi:GntR family transcriptional regulator/MocR family aminotransferase